MRKLQHISNQTFIDLRAYLTETEVAQFFKVSLTTVQREARLRNLKPKMISKVALHKQVVIDLHKHGYSYEKICQCVPLSISVIKEIINKSNKERE